MADIIPLLMYDGSNKVEADKLVTEVTDAEWGEIQSKLPDEVTKDGFEGTYIAYLRGTKAEPLQVRAASNRLFVDRYVKIWREANGMAPMYLKFKFTPNDDDKPVSYRSATMNEVVLFLTDTDKIGAPEDTKTVQVVLDSVPDQRASWVSVGGIEYKITPREYTELLAEQKKEDKEWAQQKGELVIPGSPPRARRTLPRMAGPSLFPLPGGSFAPRPGAGPPPPEIEEGDGEDKSKIPTWNTFWEDTYTADLMSFDAAVQLEDSKITLADLLQEAMKKYGLRIQEGGVQNKISPVAPTAMQQNEKGYKSMSAKAIKEYLREIFEEDDDKDVWPAGKKKQWYVGTIRGQQKKPLYVSDTMFGKFGADLQREAQTYKEVLEDIQDPGLVI